MKTTTSTEIANETRNRAEQNVLEALSDGLAHAFETSESLFKACKRLAKAGRVTMTALRPGLYSVKLRNS